MSMYEKLIEHESADVARLQDSNPTKGDEIRQKLQYHQRRLEESLQAPRGSFLHVLRCDVDQYEKLGGYVRYVF
jgi:hypothetical protein